MIEVVAALMRRGERALLCRRPEGKRHGGQWEFAGGKVEAGETGQQALRRELREELEVEVQVGKALAETTEEIPGNLLRLTLYEAEIISGEPKKTEHSDMRWVPMEALDDFDLCPADRRLAALLKQKICTEETAK